MQVLISDVKQVHVSMANHLGPSMVILLAEVSLMRRAIIERFHCIVNIREVLLVYELTRKNIKVSPVVLSIVIKLLNQECCNNHVSLLN